MLGGATETEGRLMPARGGPPSALEPPQRKRASWHARGVMIVDAIVGFNFAVALLAMMVPGGGRPPPPPADDNGEGTWYYHAGRWHHTVAPRTAIFTRWIRQARSLSGHGFMLQ